MEYDYKKMTDAELVEKARTGDQLAYKAIYEKHVAAVRGRVSKYFISDTDEAPDLSDDVNPEDEIINRQEHERLMGFIEELSPLYREIIILYMVEELEYEDIAKQVGLPLNTVRTRIRRGKALLSEMMSRGEVQ